MACFFIATCINSNHHDYYVLHVVNLRQIHANMSVNSPGEHGDR